MECEEEHFKSEGEEFHTFRTAIHLSIQTCFSITILKYAKKSLCGTPLTFEYLFL